MISLFRNSASSNIFKNTIISSIRNDMIQYSKRFYEMEASDLKKGMYIEYKGKLLETQKVTHQKVAMRGGFILADFKNLVDGSKFSHKFRSAEELEAVELFVKTAQYVGSEKNKLKLKITDGGEEEDEILEISDLAALGCYPSYFKYLPADSEYQLKEHNGKVLEFKGPGEVEMTVTSIEDLKNNLVLHFENGRTSKAPSYLAVGDRVTIRLPDEVFITKLK
ncbi:hypothetical protein DLAC_08812 [Tieghemostelium lacteum]|uniref:Translation elongation factor KOW-like domain-containing protein n=1 Tax=Tieghemostelium lacteum TaxID=361077 RepID=A0A151Z8D7_TIELA|nr:hypothetical protein DLAC_08812 [Tieghemostelium lacteum]|eukprot:KYQ90211.1 hypothetical protein DLAC_08812 [Tieghemostelium lacteum]